MIAPRNASPRPPPPVEICVQRVEVSILNAAAVLTRFSSGIEPPSAFGDGHEYGKSYMKIEKLAKNQQCDLFAKKTTASTFPVQKEESAWPPLRVDRGITRNKGDWAAEAQRKQKRKKKKRGRLAYFAYS